MHSKLPGRQRPLQMIDFLWQKKMWRWKTWHLNCYLTSQKWYFYLKPPWNSKLCPCVQFLKKLSEQTKQITKSYYRQDTHKKIKLKKLKLKKLTTHNKLCEAVHAHRVYWAKCYIWANSKTCNPNMIDGMIFTFLPMQIIVRTSEVFSGDN